MLGYLKCDRVQYDAYCRVNEFFASKLVDFLTPDDVI